MKKKSNWMLIVFYTYPKIVLAPVNLDGNEILLGKVYASLSVSVRHTVSTQSWESASDRYREKLLELIGKIGKDDRSGKTASKVHFHRSHDSHVMVM